MKSLDRPAGADGRAGSDRPALASRDRRGVLFGLAAGGVGLLAPHAAGAAAPAAAAAVPAASTGVVPAVEPLLVPFHGAHQAGIVTPQPFSCVVAAFDVLVDRRDELAGLFRDLTGLFRLLAQGGALPQDDPRLPPADNGLLGTRIGPERFTATVAVGASLFDDRFGLGSLRPSQLVDMDAFPNDALDDDLCHGDLLIQFCAETPEEVLHALRLVLKATPDRLAVKWKQEGFASTHGARSGPLGTGRNLLGFKDGTANADVRDTALMNDYVWVGPGAAEPAWAVGGSYQVVRLIRNYVEFWDRTPLGEQERIFGRHKDTGAAIGSADEFDVPDYAADPKGDKVPLDAHIRLANPRTPAETARLIRRGFNYSNGVTKSGQLDMGLLFVSFQSDLARGFVAAQNRLNGEPLEEYVKPFGGGYFFALPGVPSETAFLGEPLFAAATALPVPAATPPVALEKKG